MYTPQKMVGKKLHSKNLLKDGSLTSFKSWGKKKTFGFWSPTGLRVSYFHILFTYRQINLNNLSSSQISDGGQKCWEWTKIYQEKSHPALKEFYRPSSRVYPSHISHSIRIPILLFKATIVCLSVTAHARRLCLLHHPKVLSPIHSNSRTAIYFKISNAFPSYIPSLHRPKEKVWGERNPFSLAAWHPRPVICIITVLCGSPPLQSQGFYISRERMILITQRSGRQRRDR